MDATPAQDWSLDFIIPAYNEKDTLRALVEGITAHAQPHRHRILLIDDGSTDGSAELMNALAHEYASVELIALRKNMGKSLALAAGFRSVESDIVFTMDADLQDDPKEIPRFIQALRAGSDVVCGWKEKRLDPWHKTIPSKIYNGMVSSLFGLDLHDVNTGFKAMRREVAEQLHLYGEMHRMIVVLAKQMGYTISEIPVEHHPRRFGQSKYGFERFLRGAVDVFTVLCLGKLRAAPAHWLVPLGGTVSLLSLAGCVLALLLPWAGFGQGARAGAMVLSGTGFLAGIGVIALGVAAESLVRAAVSRDSNRNNNPS